MRQRPKNFEINRHHYLSRGLVFAGLGQSCADTLRYRDSSPYGNHGTLTGMTPSEDWVWSSELGRWCTAYDATDKNQWVKVANSSGLKSVNVPAPMSLSVWVYFIAGYTSAGDASYGTILFYINGYHSLLLRASDNRVTWLGGTVSYTNSYNIANKWVHYGVYHSGTHVWIYQNGLLMGDGDSAYNLSIEAIYIGGMAGQYFLTGSIADPMLWTGDKRSSFAILANRSDPMLGGLILPPRRKFYPIKSSIISPTTKKYYYIVKGVGVQCSY
jgi:hypothetical protein